MTYTDEELNGVSRRKQEIVYFGSGEASELIETLQYYAEANHISTNDIWVDVEEHQLQFFREMTESELDKAVARRIKKLETIKKHEENSKARKEKQDLKELARLAKKYKKTVVEEIY